MPEKVKPTTVVKQKTRAQEIDCGYVCGVVGEQCQACLRRMFLREAERASIFRTALDKLQIAASDVWIQYFCGPAQTLAANTPEFLDAIDALKAALEKSPSPYDV